jgi:predicted transposase/invertase (TIGR01784 family)
VEIRADLWRISTQFYKIYPSITIFECKTMKTDVLFYKLFEMLPVLPFRLANIFYDQTAGYRFESVELKQQAQRPDGVLMPERMKAPVIVTEVQFQSDAMIYTRLVSETALLQLQHPERENWEMVLFLRSESIDVPRRMWQALVDSEHLHVVYLDKISVYSLLPVIRPFIEAEQEAALHLLHLTTTPVNVEMDRKIAGEFASANRQADSTALRKTFQELFVNLMLSKHPSLSYEEILAMIDTVEIFDSIGENRSVREYAERIAQKVKVEAKMEGKLEGKLETVRSLLTMGLSIQQVADALQLPVDVIERESR